MRVAQPRPRGLMALALVIAAMGLLALATYPLWRGSTGPREHGVSSSSDPRVAPESAHPTAGSRIYKDPVTGELGVPPSESRFLSPPRAQPLAPGSVGLIETLAPGPTGGIQVHLHGRFRSALHAAKDAEGHIAIHCE